MASKYGAELLIQSQINYPLPNSNGTTVEVWEWIIYFDTRFEMDVITYPRWD